MHFTVLVVDIHNEGYDNLLEPFASDIYPDKEIYFPKDVAIEELKLKGDWVYEGVPDSMIDEYERQLWDIFHLEVDENLNAINRFNSRAKWDWFVVGGRWQGTMPLKDGTFEDWAKIKDVDFSGDNKKYNKALRFWEVFVDEEELKDGEDPEDFKTYMSKVHFLSAYKTKENYAKAYSSFSTYALLIEDDWIEVDDFENTMEYRKEFKRRIDEVLKNYPEAEVTLIDCHM